MKRKLPPKVSGRRVKSDRGIQKEDRQKIDEALKRSGDHGFRGWFRQKKSK